MTGQIRPLRNAGGTGPCPAAGAWLRRSPESPVVAVVPLIAVGGALVLALLIANAQGAEVGVRVCPGGAALTEEFTCTGGAREVSSSYLSKRVRLLPSRGRSLVQVPSVAQNRAVTVPSSDRHLQAPGLRQLGRGLGTGGAGLSHGWGGA